MVKQSRIPAGETEEAEVTECVFILRTRSEGHAMLSDEVNLAF